MWKPNLFAPILLLFSFPSIFQFIVELCLHKTMFPLKCFLKKTSKNWWKPWSFKAKIEVFQLQILCHSQHEDDKITDCLLQDWLTTEKFIPSLGTVITIWGKHTEFKLIPWAVIVLPPLGKIKEEEEKKKDK